jgi:hypothetical protein
LFADERGAIVPDTSDLQMDIQNDPTKPTCIQPFSKTWSIFAIDHVLVAS